MSALLPLRKKDLWSYHTSVHSPRYHPLLGVVDTSGNYIVPFKIDSNMENRHFSYFGVI